MFNILFELDNLRSFLRSRGLDNDAIEGIVNKANAEIRAACEEQGKAAMDRAIAVGVEQRSSDFINELRMDLVNMELTTESGNFNFSEPPYPMLNKLLQNGAKPISDGSGVYKVIPVGAKGKNRPLISSNIFDVQKQLSAERVEASKAAYTKITAKSSKQEFRTATSKQNATSQWVIPPKEKDFSSDMKDINSEVATSIEEAVRNIIQSYQEAF